MPQDVPLDIHQSSHVFFYDTKTAVTAGQLADSLNGLEGIVLALKPVLRSLLEVPIKDIEVLITGVEIGSYKENFFVRLVFGKGLELERNIEKLRTKFGLKAMDTTKLIGLVVLGGVLYAIWSFVAPADPARIQIVNSFNQIGGTNLSGEDIVKIVQGALSDRQTETLKKNVVRIVNPGGVPHEGRIQLDDDPQLVVEPNLLQKIPVKYEGGADDAVPQKDFDQVILSIRAADLDNPNKGWAAILPDAFEGKRVPVHVMPEVPINSVPIGRYFVGDVTVVYSVKPGRAAEPKQYLLRKVYGAEELAVGKLQVPE